jgi:hypothetical protein
MDSWIESYLSRYSSAKDWPLPPSELSWQHFALVPARREQDEIFRLLKSFDRLDSSNHLLMIVINSNAKAQASEFEMHERLMKKIESQFSAIWKNQRLSLFRAKQFDILLADWGSSPDHCHPKMNVGLARKMAADYAVHLYAQRQLRSAWIHSTDADATIPKDYFSFSKSEALSAYHYRYRHEFDEDLDIQTAAIFYEIYLRYHRLGLKFSGSAYAHPSIGSCLCIQIPFYVKSRGFPAREAGEDFYLLNKLRKLAPLDWSSAQPVSILARSEVRTVFGTAAGIQKILREGFLLDDPDVFDQLKNHREHLLKDAEDFPKSAESFEPKLQRSLKNFKSRQARRRHMEELFDGLREIQWIRSHRTKGFLAKPWSEALQKASFLSSLRISEPLSILEQLRKIDEESL